MANAAAENFGGMGRRYNSTTMPRAAKPADKAREPDRKPDTSGISTLLRAWSDGDQSALEGLTPIVYEELRRLAHYYMERERSGHSLQTTALVNEAWMRLVDYKRMQWQDRAHFSGLLSCVGCSKQR